MKYREELETAYREYYSERNAMEDSNASPEMWELSLWNKWEEKFFEIYRKYYR